MPLKYWKLHSNYQFFGMIMSSVWMFSNAGLHDFGENAYRLYV